MARDDPVLPVPDLTCPSAQPGGADARAFGVVGGTAEEPRIAYLKRDAEVGPETLAKLGDVDPTLVFRFAARCENGRCAQYAGGRCGLAQRIADQLAPVVELLPSCQIRPTCRWHHEIGAAACLRCPQVTTRVPPERAALAKAAAIPE